MLSRQMVFGAALIAMVSVTSSPHLASAQPLATTAAVERLFSGDIERDWLADAFAAEVPPEHLAGLIEQMTAEFGLLQSVEGAGERLTVRLESADVPTQVALDSDGRIAGLLFEAPIPLSGGIDDHIATIAALPGATSVLVTTDGATLAAHEPDAVLAVGSAAKLAILKALDEAIAGERLAMDDVFPLDPTLRSLPTGILQTWPAETPVTIATLANLMISQSDNTATDALVHLVGREVVEAITARNTPFPTTAELFKLMARETAALTAEWREGTEAERRALLARLADLPLPAASALTSAAGVEWYMTASELCALLDEVADNPAFAINPGLASPGDWAEVAFKGGSDIGVLNFSTRLVGADGRVHCVVATWNDDAELSAQRLATPYRGILRALATAAN